jgi:hypothetical protein
LQVLDLGLHLLQLVGVFSKFQEPNGSGSVLRGGLNRRINESPARTAGLTLLSSWTSTTIAVTLGVPAI